MEEPARGYERRGPAGGLRLDGVARGPAGPGPYVPLRGACRMQRAAPLTSYRLLRIYV